MFTIMRQDEFSTVYFPTYMFFSCLSTRYMSCYNHARYTSIYLTIHPAVCTKQGDIKRMPGDIKIAPQIVKNLMYDMWLLLEASFGLSTFNPDDSHATQ